MMTLTLARLVAATVLLVAAPLAAEAQPDGRAHRVGLLAGGSAAATASVRAAVVTGLEELGYREGRTVVLVERYAEGKFERLPGLAAELIGSEVEVILTSTTPATLAARRATSTIPIVVVTSGDLVGSGVVASLARPGGNVTGLSFLGTELAVKQMELLKQVAPAVRSLGLLANRAIRPEVLFFEAMERGAPELGVKVRFVDVRGPSDYEAAFATMQRERVGGLVVAPNLINVENRKAIVALAARTRLPAVYQSREFPESGGLISYGIDRPAFFRRAAIYVDRIVRGVKAGDLPIEQPTQFELVINMKTARALGLPISPSLRLRADHVIE
jgi:putative ABC transport system substrate-binding protein